MKKAILLVATIFCIATGFSQSEKYTTKMTALVAQMDTTFKLDELNNLSTGFERVADAEKTQWLPYYYASLCKLNATMQQLGSDFGDKTSITDPAADKAEELLNKAIGLSKETSETYIIKKMIASLRMMGNPMQRYMEFGAKAKEALEEATKLDANNPRIYLLEGQDKFYTPEQFGGSKSEAKVLFTKAQELYKTFKPETALHPNWGLKTVVYLLNQIK